MAIYINSKGQQLDTNTMATPHLERALAKAIRDGANDNAEALQEELDSRETNE